MALYLSSKNSHLQDYVLIKVIVNDVEKIGLNKIFSSAGSSTTSDAIRGRNSNH